MSRPLDRARAFAARFGLAVPVLMAPMAGASPPALAAAVAEAGDTGRMYLLAGQAAGRAQEMPAGGIVARMWTEAQALLG